MTYSQTAINGYTVTICLRCVTTNTEYGRFDDDFTFTITQAALDCSSILSPAGTGAQTHEYDGVTTTVVYNFA